MSSPAPTPHGRAPGKSAWWKSVWFIAAVAAVVGIAIGAGASRGGDKKAAADAATVTATATATVNATVTATPVVTRVIETKTRVRTETYTPPPPKALTDGTYVVGVDIKPGTYHSAGGGSYCAWVRAKDKAGSDIIDLGNSSGGPLTVVVKSSDGSLVIQGDCSFSRR